MVPAPRSDFWRGALSWAKKNSTKLLSLGSVLSIFGTGFAVYKARPIADRALKDAELKKGSPLTTKEKFKVAMKYYAPATGIAIGGSICAITAEVKNGKRAEALSGLYAFSTAGYQTFRQAVDKKFGEGAAKEVDDIIHADDKVIQHSDGFRVDDGLGASDDKEVIFIDDFSRKKFVSTIGRVLDAQIGMMTCYQSHGEVRLQQWYEMIGIWDSFCDASKEVIDQLFWSYDGQAAINCDGGWYPCSVEKREVGGEECYVIYFHTPPYPDFYELDQDLYSDILPSLKTHLDEI